MKFNSLIPELNVADINKSISFYVDVLGFKVEYFREADKFVFLSLDENQIMLEQHNGHWQTAPLEYPLGRGINFQMSVSNISPMLSALKDINYPLMRDAYEVEYRVDNNHVTMREFLVQDLDGYVLRFSQ